MIKQKLKKYWRWFLLTICGVGIAFAAPILPDTVQEAFAKSELQGKYEFIADRIVTKTAHIDDAKVEISTLEPQAVFSKWDNEVDIKIKPKGAKKQKPKFEGEKIKFKENKKEHHFYEVENGYEIETILLEKPTSNIVEYEIETKGLDFFYQPELTQEEIDEGAFRPENVIGSYAVYHSTKQGDYSKMGGKNYRAGKAFHIYRPLIIDANSAEVWGEMNIESGLLTVTIPQSFLDNAVYPVVVDPTFGYTTSGANYWSTGQDGSLVAKYTLPVNGSVSKLTASLLEQTVESTNVKGLIYVDNSGEPGALKGVSNPALVDFGATEQWVDLTFSSSIELTAGDYWLGISSDSNYTKFFYTNEEPPDIRLDSDNYTSPSDPWDTAGDSGFTNRHMSIYATYTATGGAERRIIIIE